jgi:hypothetical protein
MRCHPELVEVIVIAQISYTDNQPRVLPEHTPNVLSDLKALLLSSRCLLAPDVTYLALGASPNAKSPASAGCRLDCPPACDPGGS